MNRQRSLLVLIVVPAVVSLAVSLLVLYIWDRNQPETSPLVLPTHGPTSIAGDIDSGEESSDQNTGDSDSSQGETSDGDDDQDETASSSTISPDCENEIHVVQSGQVLGSIADQYGITVDELITMNQLINPDFDPDILSVGQQLTIPTCGIPEPTPTSPPTSTPTATVPAPIPTPTPPPPGTVQLVIIEVLNVGDITSERVEILNEGTPVQMDGWLLVSEDGDEFEFPAAYRLYTGGRVHVHTGVGENTPIDLYWGLNESIWNPGDVVQLIDPDGEVHAEFTIPE